MVQKFTTANFDSEALQAQVPVLVDFYADWCGPCKMMAPVVEQISEEYAGRITVGKINVDEEPELAGRYSVMSIPTIIVFQGGEAVKKTIGAQQKKVLADILDSLL